MRDSTRCLARILSLALLSLVLALPLGLAVERSAWQAEGSTFNVQPANVAAANSQPTATPTSDSGTANPHLTFTLSAWPEVVPRYGTLIYTLSLTNTGAISLTGLTITASLPDGLFYLPHPAVGNGWYDAEGRRVIWELPSCPPAHRSSAGLGGPEGACFSAAFQADVMESAPDFLDVEAEVQAGGQTLASASATLAVEGSVGLTPPTPSPTLTPATSPSPTPTATAFVFLTPTVSPSLTPAPAASPTPTLVAPAPPRLAFTLAVSPTAVFPGDLLTYTLAMSNTGEALLTSLTVSDTLPDGLAYLPGSATAGQFDPQNRRFMWEISALASDTREARFQARVRGDVLDDLIVNRAEVTGGGLVHPVGARATVAVMRRAPITPEGGVLETPNGRVRAEFPPGAVDGDVQVTYRPLDVRRLPSGQTGLALQFELSARPAKAKANGPPVTRFQKPLRLTVDLRGLVDEAALGPYKRLFVGYLDETSGRWVHLPVVERQAGPVLTVEVDHFSTFGVGADGVMHWGWSLTFNDAQVSLFNGAFTYNYPLEVPPGRGGLQPNLNLSYNSRRVDGILTWVQTDWAGLGWSIDTAEIVRQGVRRDEGCDGICYKNEFVLVLNGTAYELKPALQGQDYGRYHTEDESFVYVERRNAAGGNGSPENATSEYWVVRTKDGIEHQLGYTADAEQVFGPYDNHDGEPASGYVGTSPDLLAAFRWRVKRVADLHGNQLVYHYFEETKDQQCNAEGDNCWGELNGGSERASYLDSIEYNHRDDGQPGVKIIFQTALRDSGSDPVDDRWSAPIASGQWPGIPLAVFWQRYYLQGIRVQAWDELINNFVTVREHEFTYDEREVPPEQHNNHTRRLRSITLKGRDGQTLPATTFNYTVHQNKGWCPDCSSEWDREVFRYERLSQINNGYGGVITAQYETPDAGYWHAYNYRVSHRETKDRGTVVSQVDYAYPQAINDRCYEDNGTCHSGDFPGGQTGGELVGYKWSIETLKDRSGATVAVIEHDFWLKAGKTSPTFALGREIETRFKAPGGTTLRTVQRTYVDDTTGRPGGVHFIYLDEIKTCTYGEGSQGACQREKYTYDSYGNRTEVIAYQADQVTPYRRTLRGYHARTDLWIVDRPRYQNLYAWNGSDWELKASTWYTYDGNDHFNDPLGDKAELTAVRLWVVKPDGQDGFIDTRYSYDPYGNRETVTTFDDYGLCYPPDNTNCPFASSNPATTATTYDQVYHVFPVQEQNAAGHITHAYYYGVNGSGATTTGAFFGKVESVTDPNGVATTYKYDVFGRMTQEYRPYDTSEPTVRVEYTDKCTAGPCTVAPPVKVRVDYREKHNDTNAFRPILHFYDGLGREIQTKAESVNGNEMIVTNTSYDARGLVKDEYVPYKIYDPGSFWNYVTPDTTKPKTSYTYDGLERVTQVAHPDGTVTAYVYGVERNDADPDFVGGREVVYVIDANQHFVRRSLDAYGRLQTVSESTGTYPNWGQEYRTRYAYDVVGNLTDVWDAANNHTRMVYDRLGRKTSMTDPDMGTWYYEYDAAGNLVRQTDARNQTTCFYYDEINRLKGKAYRTEPNCPSDPGYSGYAVSYAYDNYLGDADAANSWGRRRVTWVGSWPNQTNKHAYQYDERGRVVTETVWLDGAGYETNYTYYADDQLQSMTYPDGEVITYTYTAQGLPDSLKGTLAGQFNNYPYVQGTTYNAWGQPTQMLLGNGLTTQYTYHPLNSRLRRIHTGSFFDLHYGYDLVGNVAAIYDASRDETLHYGYDPLDRLTAFQKAPSSLKPVTIRARGSNADGWPIMQLRVNGVVVQEWTVDTTDWTDYTAQAPLSGDDRVDVVFTNDYCCQYGDRNLWVDYVVVDGQTVEAESGAVEYDRGWGETAFDGQDVIPGQEGMYWAGALRTEVVSSSGWTVEEEYAYNEIGNLISKGGVTYTYPPSGPTSVRPHAVITTSAGFNAAYDANGNMTNRNGATLTYDAENRLERVTEGGRVTTFVYDADGRRVKKVTPWSTTYYIGVHYEKHIPAAGLSILPGDTNTDCQVNVADVQTIAVKWGLSWGDAGYGVQYDVDQDGNVDAGDVQTVAANWRASVPSPCTSAVTKYYRLGGRLVALRQNGQLHYVHTDHLGSVSLLTDESGRVVPGNEQRFLPFGKVRAGQPAILPTGRNFTGQSLDVNTGLLYYGARYYDPALGRWTQPDTIVPNLGDPQDLNRYSYVRNNPLRYTDPTGHCIPGVNCPGNRYQDEPQIAPSPPHYDFTDDQWNAVETWSDYFGLPTEFTAAVVAAEVLYDTSWYDRPMDMAIGSVAWTGILFSLDSQKFYSYWWAEAFFERSQTGLPFLGGLTFGPGIGQVHAATAIQAEQHFGENFPVRPETASMRHLLLVQDETNIMYVAAILRMHADQRPGSRDASGQMSVDEMGAVFANYHEDVSSAFGSQQAYEAGASPTASGQRWVDQLRPLIWYHRIHGR